jgi:hypothetical protein
MVFELIISTGNAFAAGYAYAKAVFEFERASWGVKRRAFGASAKPISPLDSPACAKRIVGWLQGKRSDALNRSESFG